MEANNSMINPELNESSQTFKDSRTEENSNISMTLSKTKMKEKTKTPKGKKFKIECANNPELKFEINSEEFTIHIITCDDCLKQLLLNQARLEKYESQVLNDRNNKSKKNKKKGKKGGKRRGDINN